MDGKQIYQPAEGVRAVYLRKTTHTPYQNLSPAISICKKRYTISAPRPGEKADDYNGIGTLQSLKQRFNLKRTLLNDVPIGLQSRHNRYVLKVPDRRNIQRANGVVIEAQPQMVSHHEEIMAVEEEVLEDELIQRSTSFGVPCSECGHSFYSRIQLLRHVEEAHGITAPLIRKDFDTQEQLNAWLASLKTTHDLDFITVSGSRDSVKAAYRITYLNCSRGGEQRVRKNRKTKSTRCTIKSGRSCVAFLKIRQSLCGGKREGPLMVEGCLHHSGHSIDPSRLQLTPQEESAIMEVVRRHERGVATHITTARAFLDTCSRFRLVQDNQLASVLPQWMIEVQKKYHDRMEGGETSRVMNDESFPHQIHNQLQPLVHPDEMLSLEGRDSDEDEMYVSVV